MNESKLDKYRVVRPDPESAPVHELSVEDKYALNRQTGFNRPLLESSDECGCFYCGRRFPTALVEDWMAEPGEEDTGLCPYCGEDALVVGTEECPLGTALLARMYEEWAEPDLVLERGLILWPLWPGRMSHDEYLRRGLTFHDV